MNSRLPIPMLVAVILAWTTAARAQDQQPSQEEQNQLNTVNASAPPAQPPGDDVMQPTKHGIRLTPNLARAIGRSWVSEALEKDKGMVLNDDQKSKIGEAFARRMMQVGHDYGKEVGPFLEFTLESVAMGRGGIHPANPEQAKEFARRAKPTMPAWHDFFGHLTDDCRPYMDADQLGQVKEMQDLVLKALDRFDKRMDRWAEGQLKDKETPFDDLDDLAAEDSDPASPAKPKRSPEVKQAERTATFGLRRLGGDDWRDFLNSVRTTFHLTDEQYARGTALLGDYIAKAKGIMTPQWLDKAKNNRIQYNLRFTAANQPLGPWRYHLDREYEEMTKPVKDLGRAFRQDVLGLVTREQREAVLAELHEFALKHGMTAEEADIRFPTTRPD